jgi:hypothetical protein
LLYVYAVCIVSQDEAARLRVMAALRLDDAPDAPCRVRSCPVRCSVNTEQRTAATTGHRNGLPHEKGLLRGIAG